MPTLTFILRISDVVHNEPDNISIKLFVQIPLVHSRFPRSLQSEKLKKVTGVFRLFSVPETKSAPRQPLWPSRSPFCLLIRVLNAFCLSDKRRFLCQKLPKRYRFKVKMQFGTDLLFAAATHLFGQIAKTLTILCFANRVPFQKSAGSFFCLSYNARFFPVRAKPMHHCPQ